MPESEADRFYHEAQERQAARIERALVWVEQQQDRQARRAAIWRLFWTGIAKTGGGALMLIGLLSGLQALAEKLGWWNP